MGSLVPKGARALAAKSVEDPALASATGLFLGSQAAPFGRALNPIAGVEQERTDQAIRARRLAEARRDRAARLRRSIEQNIVRIAATDPHLYQELMYGERLPRGATVIGGRPRTDFIEEVAFQMATGKMSEQREGVDGLLGELTAPTR